VSQGLACTSGVSGPAVDVRSACFVAPLGHATHPHFGANTRPVAPDEATTAAAAAVTLKDLLPISACAWADKGWLGDNNWNAIAAVDR